MELRELKAFVTVAAEHSFSRAAIKLCRAQPVVSQGIRRLDEDLGERLFDRTLTLVYRDNDRQPNAVEDFVEVFRSTGEDRASRTAPIAMRISR